MVQLLLIIRCANTHTDARTRVSNKKHPAAMILLAVFFFSNLFTSNVFSQLSVRRIWGAGGSWQSSVFISEQITAPQHKHGEKFPKGWPLNNWEPKFRQPDRKHSQRAYLSPPLRLHLLPWQPRSPPAAHPPRLRATSQIYRLEHDAASDRWQVLLIYLISVRLRWRRGKTNKVKKIYK